MSTANELEHYMLELINEERRAAGLEPLRLELRLNSAAEDHSLWMIDNDVFSHTGVGGSSAGERMEAANFEFSGNWRWAENIAWQSVRGEAGLRDDVENLHNSLMNSPGHRANILSSTSEVIGIGIERGEYQGWDALFVTQKFARTSAELQIDDPDAIPEPEPPANALPVVTVEDQTIVTSAWRKLIDVASISDADGDSVTWVEIWDNDGGNNWWADGGIVDASRGYWTRDIEKVWFQGDTVGGSQDLWVRGWDGTEAGEWDRFILETESVNTRPEVLVANQSVQVNQWIRLTDVLEFVDVDGDRIRELNVWDNVGGDNWWADGGMVDASRGYSTSNISGVWFRGDAFESGQRLWVQANDGTEWSSWDSFILETA